jgi:ammonia channel protein AmtB
MSSIINFIKSSWAAKDSRLSWIVKYSLACIVLIVGFIVIFRHVLGLDLLSYDSQIGVAALFGIAGVIGLSVALMAATFYSSRSGKDDEFGESDDR